ncbi:MAG: diguanylate cyclase [Burkholderiaceae bacterium]
MKPTVIRNLCLATLLFTQLAAITALVIAMQRDMTSRVDDDARGALNRLAANVTDQTKLYLAQAESALISGEQLIRDGILKPNSDRALERFFIAQLQSGEWLNGMYLGRSDGSFVYVSRHDEGIRTKLVKVTPESRHIRHIQYDQDLNVLLRWPSPHDSFDPRNRPWYAKARASNGIAWTDAYAFYSSGRPGISAARSVTLDDKDAGVIGIDIDIGALSTFLARLPGNGAGSAMIVDANHHVVASSELLALNNALGAGVPVNFARLADKALIAVANAQAHELPEPGLDPGFDTVTTDSSSHYGIARPFQLNHGVNQWHLYAQVPISGYSGGLTAFLKSQLQWLLLLIVVPALLAALALYRLSARAERRHLAASHDPLTGALNRPDFEQAVARLMHERRGQQQSTLVLAAVDIDNFNRVNVQFGHHAGDSVLRAAVHRLRKQLRREDLVCRTGGDHFLIATRVDHQQDALPTMRRLHQSMVRKPVTSMISSHEIGATMGIAMHTNEESVHELILRAGQALITGKLSGKNRCYMAAHFHALLDNSNDVQTLGGGVNDGAHDASQPDSSFRQPSR